MTLLLRTPGPADRIYDDLRSCLRRHLSQVNADLVLQRSASRCGIRPEAVDLALLPRFLEHSERALALYLDDAHLAEAQRDLRETLESRGMRLGRQSRPSASSATPQATPRPERSGASSAQPRLASSSAQPRLASSSAQPRLASSSAQPRLASSSGLHAAAPAPAQAPAAADLPVEKDADIEAAQTAALQMARLQGLARVDTVKVATVVSELARNILKYAGHGTLRLSPIIAPFRGIRVVAVDHGPGIPDLESILGGSYCSRTGMGLGILGSKKLMDSFEVESVPHRGTTIKAEKYA